MKLRTTLLTLAIVGAGIATQVIPGASQGEPLTAAQRDAVKALIVETLKSNPEVITEALQELQRRNEESEQAAKRTGIRDNKTALFETTHGLTGGNPQGTATLVEFFDYNCSACRSGFPEIVKAMEADPNLRVIFKELPIIDRENSPKVARLSVASAAQGKYFNYHRALMAASGRLNEAKALDIAKQLGLDLDKLKADAASAATTTVLSDTEKLADTLKLEGTPAIIIGETFFAGAIPQDTIAEAVSDIRKNGCAVC